MEVVESGSKNIEIAVLRRGVPLEYMTDEAVEALVGVIEAEKAAEEAEKKSKKGEAQK